MEIFKKLLLQLSDNNNPYISTLARSYPLREEMLISAINFPDLSRDGMGLDLGCGIGLTTLLLADTIRPNIQVTGIDISDKFLQIAEKTAKSTELSKRVFLSRATHQTFHLRTIVLTGHLAWIV